MNGPLARFLATGILNTAFGYGVYAGLVACGLPYLAALVLATVAGVIFNFFSFGHLAFRARLGGERFARFVAAYCAILALNAALLWVVRHVAGLDPYTAQLVCLPPTVIATYLILQNWVYGSARARGN